MNTSVQEHWQLVEDILRKSERSRPDGQQLQQSVAVLLTTPEGRESVRRRLDGEGGPFDGKHRFIDEICRALEKPGSGLGEMNPRDRLAIQETVVERTRPKVDPAHWNMLWLLHREGHLGVGQKVLDSLAKVTKKSDDLARTLPLLRAWERLAPNVFSAANA
jgi:hypothetical protein